MFSIYIRFLVITIFLISIQYFRHSNKGTKSKTILVLTTILTLSYLFIYIFDYFKEKKATYYYLYNETKITKNSPNLLKEMLKLENQIIESRNKYIFPLKQSFNKQLSENIKKNYSIITFKQQSNNNIISINGTNLKVKNNQALSKEISTLNLRSTNSIFLDSLTLVSSTAYLLDDSIHHSNITYLEDSMNNWVLTNKIDSSTTLKIRSQILDLESSPSLRVNMLRLFISIIDKNYDKAVKYGANCFALDRNNGLMYYLLSKIPLSETFRFGFNSKKSFLEEAFKLNHRNYYLLKALAKELPELKQDIKNEIIKFELEKYYE